MSRVRNRRSVIVSSRIHERRGVRKRARRNRVRGHNHVPIHSRRIRVRSLRGEPDGGKHGSIHDMDDGRASHTSSLALHIRRKLM